MKTRTALGIGVIGTGIMGSDHVKTISSAISGAEIRATTDIDFRRAEAIAAITPGAKAFSSAEDLIASPEVEAVIIASNDVTHARYVAGCLAAGKPVLCEKPLAPSVQECEKILSLEEAAGERLVQVGFMRRFDPGYVEMHNQIKAGVIGTPILAHCVHRNVNMPEGWKSETTVTNSAVHEIDIMPWLFGREVVEVNWFSPTAAAPQHLSDPQVVILKLEGGALVFTELFMKSAYGYEIRCEVVGDKGTLELAPPGKVMLRSALKMSGDFPPDWRGRFPEAYRRELQSWVAAIHCWHSGATGKGIGPVDGPDAWDGYRAAVIAQAVLSSMSKGTPVLVESLPVPEFYRHCRLSSTNTE